MVANTLEGASSWALLFFWKGRSDRISRRVLVADVLAVVERALREKANA